jgi:hypothetical protein
VTLDGVSIILNTALAEILPGLQVKVQRPAERPSRRAAPFCPGVPPFAQFEQQPASFALGLFNLFELTNRADCYPPGAPIREAALCDEGLALGLA